MTRLLEGERIKRKMWQRLNTYVPNEDRENPNSFFRVSLMPENLNAWIGVVYTVLSVGIRISDAKWIDQDRDEVLRGMKKAEDPGEGVGYYIYSPENEIGARKRELVRGTDFFSPIEESF